MIITSKVKNYDRDLIHVTEMKKIQIINLINIFFCFLVLILFIIGYIFIFLLRFK